MNRWNELKYTLGLNILFPRFCLFMLIPCGLLFAVPSPPEFPLLVAVLHPLYAKVVVMCSLLLFGLNVAANLGISRYLRLHQAQDSPYTYKAEWDYYSRSGYFRIHVSDKSAFRQMLKGISQDHSTEVIRYWLLLDDILFLSAAAALALTSLVFMLLTWLAKCSRNCITRRKPRPAAQG